MCVQCSNDSCSGGCSVTRQITSENNSLGRDGESAYEAYVRLGGTLTEAEWTALNINSSYSEFDW